jgi:hypothetical protein
MISPAKTTLPAVEKYLMNKIKLLKNGMIRSSPKAQAKICQFRKYDKGICPACSKMKAKNTEEGVSTYSSSSED